MGFSFYKMGDFMKNATFFALCLLFLAGSTLYCDDLDDDSYRQRQETVRRDEALYRQRQENIQRDDDLYRQRQENIRRDRERCRERREAIHQENCS